MGYGPKMPKPSLNYFPACPKAQLAIRKPITKEQPKTFSEELHLVIWIF